MSAELIDEKMMLTGKIKSGSPDPTDPTAHEQKSFSEKKVQPAKDANAGGSNHNLSVNLNLSTNNTALAKDLDVSRTYSAFNNSKATLGLNSSNKLSTDDDGGGGGGDKQLNIYNTLSKNGSTADSKMTDSKSNSSNIYAGGTQTSLSLNRSINEKSGGKDGADNASKLTANLADASKSSTGVSSQSGKTDEKSSSVATNNLNNLLSASASGASSVPMKTTATSLSATTAGGASGASSGGDSIMPQQSRKKVILGKGYSLMDWIRVTKENPNLAGNYGVMRKITPEELALHNKENDCWLALFGKVYNVTPYMKFHPGGIDELMRGAGANATDLFNDVHPWVNLQGMLEKCVIGTLVTNEVDTASNKSNDKPATLSKSNTLGVKSTTVPVPLPTNKPLEAAIDPEPFVASAGAVNKPEIKLIRVASKDNAEIPVLDSYQTNEYVNIVIYTKWKKMKLDNVIIDKFPSNGQTNTLVLYIYTHMATYKYSIDIPAPIKDDYDLKLSKDGKIDLIIFKIEKIHWWQMCPKLNFQAEIVYDTSRGVNFRECTIVDKVKVTHDTDLYYLGLPASTRMSVPLGYHVYIRLPNDDLSTKPYTVIDDSLLASSSQPSRSDGKVCRTPSSNFGKQICLMIKHYPDGYLTSKLKKLGIDSKLEVSNFTGSFELERLEDCDELILICAGTGFTPMIRLINYLLESNSTSKIQLIFFNKTSKDILWKEQLAELGRLKAKRFDLVNVLSQPEPDWKGRQGRISAELLAELVGSKPLTKPLFCVCGPKPFTDQANLILQKQLKFTSDSIHLFLS